MMDRQTARSLPRTLFAQALRRLSARRAPRNCDNSRLRLRVAAHRYWPLAPAIAAWGCGATASPATTTGSRFEIDVRVESDPSKPLAAVGILQGAKELARTSQDGTARVKLAGKNGDVIALRVACPEGFATPEKPLSITLRPLVGTAVVPEYRAQCEPLVRSLVVAVRTKNGADLPVKHLGREIARTDADGVAHALLRVPPSEQVTLVLDTSDPARERLRPKSPELTLLMPARDQVAVFDQAFSELAPPVVKRKKLAPQPVGPVKIQAPNRY